MLTMQGPCKANPFALALMPGIVVKLSHLLRRAGTRGVRTRAITANNDGKVEWVERLILELKGPKGTPPLHS